MGRTPEGGTRPPARARFMAHATAWAKGARGTSAVSVHTPRRAGTRAPSGGGGDVQARAKPRGRPCEAP
eukprot:3440780-Lingulodinium_polyedra.AAC.1